MSTTITTTTPPSPPTFPTHPLPRRHTTWPYTPADFTREDPTPDTSFYTSPRYVTHIDDHAITLLRSYYAQTLPSAGKILDLCSSWVSHFPKELEERAVITARKQDGEKEEEGRLEVIGLGMNSAELSANPILSARVLHDLNAEPTLPTITAAATADNNDASLSNLDATVCVVSIDYLTQPHLVLSSLLTATKPGGVVHLVLSNRCFPTKAIARWLRVSEQERVRMVGDYLWESGWEGVEVVEVCDGVVKEGEEGMMGQGEMGRLMGMLGMGRGRCDPLWVVRGRKGGAGMVERSEGKSEL